MISIPTESRATMMAYRAGRSEQQFLDEMWARRSDVQPGKERAEGKWPMHRGAQPALPPISEAAGVTTVTSIRKRAGARP